MVLNVSLELAAELLEKADHRHGRCVAERAEGAAQHVLGEVAHVIDIFHRAVAFVEAGHRLLQPVCAFAAGDAPAAALLLVELDGAERKLDDRDRLIKDDDAGGTEHGTRLAHLVEVHANIDLVRAEDGTRCAAGHYGLECLAVGNAAGNVVDHLLQVVTHRQLVDAGPIDVAADAEQARAAIALCADLRVCGAAHLDDEGHAGDGFGVVDDCGTAIQPDHGGEGRLDARYATLAFERLHQGGFLADFIGTSAGLRDGVKIEGAAEDVLAQDAALITLRQRPLRNLEKIAVLATEIDETHLRANGQPGDHGAFDDGVRVVQEDQVVLAGAGFALVAVDQHVLGLLALFGHEGPLHTGGKACATAAAKAGGLHLIDDPLGALLNALAQGRIATKLDVLIDVGGTLTPAAGDEFDFVGMGDELGH